MIKRTLHTGSYLGLYSIDDWEFAERPNATAVVGILAITPDRQIVLVEQFRTPIQQTCIEIPAGLVGDEPEFAGEGLAATASRELLEETGYSAGAIEHLLSSPTSAGMTSEFTHLFLATELERVTDGGGTDSEDITVHHVPLDDLDRWLADRARSGIAIDFKIHAALRAAHI